jgi:class 3 adenylate cyclase
MRCSACGTDNADAQKFCGECGATLVRRCPGCGTAVPPGQKFCGECGTPVDGAAARSVASAAPASVEQVAERRVASILFVDLVGFTSLSEHRDAEDVRELLTQYFDTARTIVSRYGGVVEKFIGDAVMAVWGTPARHEDDAERAVRTGLDIITAVSELGRSAGIEKLQARAGVVTAEVAVTLGATGQGMVAGDPVNTAARLQSLADPGLLLVDEATYRATNISVAYRHDGERPVKGRAEPVQVYVAERVVSGRSGAQRVDGLEARFIGRDSELRLVKELFHAVVDQGRARLISISGLPGVGKSRLAWEFFKYLDGVADTFLWHVGRCLPYGEGVAYWALADIVRMRLGIVEGDSAEVAAQRLAEWLDASVPDDVERNWLRPRLAVLLGASDGAADDSHERADLFAAWRRFFERLSEDNAVVVVIEDLQWADTGLLDFLSHLLDWSTEHPLCLVTLSRPDVYERHPDWANNRRTATTIHLDPLDEWSMAQLADDLVDGLPADVRDALVARAEGVPLYAIETVRMLVDRDLVVPSEGRYVLAPHADASMVVASDIPASLQAVVAARLDGLTDTERRVLQDASVLGLSFTAEALTDLLDGGATEVARTLTTLVRKEILGVHADPRSPERGQYRFLQAVVRSVAYGTLSRRARRSRHLRAVELLEARPDVDELPAVIATHLLDAAESVEGDQEAVALRRRAAAYLERAGDRAVQLGAPADARRHYERAMTLVEEEPARMALGARAGLACLSAAEYGRAEDHLTTVHAYYSRERDWAALAGIAASEGELGFALRRIGETLTLLEATYSEVAVLGVTADVARIEAAIARCHFFLGDDRSALDWADRSLATAEGSGAGSAWLMGLNYRALACWRLHRPRETFGLLLMAVEHMRRHPADFFGPVYNNLALFSQTRDLATAVTVGEEGLAAAQRVGDIDMMAFQLCQIQNAKYLQGEWDEVLSITDDALRRDWGSARGALFLTTAAMLIAWHRGEPDRAHELRRMTSDVAGDDIDMAAHMRAGLAIARLAASDAAGAFDALTVDVDGERQWPDTSAAVHFAWKLNVEVAIAAGRPDLAAQEIDPAHLGPEPTQPPYQQAHVLRFRVLLGDLEGTAADAAWAEAERLLDELSAPFELATVRLDHAEWLAARGRAEGAAATAALALATFDRLGAASFTERARVLASPAAVGA